MGLRGPKPINFEGFEKEISKVRSCISRYGKAFGFYEEGKGFTFRKEITPFVQGLINQGKLTFIGVYTSPLKANDIIDDMKFELKERLNN